MTKTDVEQRRSKEECGPECSSELCDYEVRGTSLETRCYQVTITEDTGYRANE